MQRIVQNDYGEYFSPKDSIPIVRRILNNNDLEESIKDKNIIALNFVKNII